MNNNNNKYSDLKNRVFLLSYKDDDFEHSFLTQDGYNNLVPEPTLSRHKNEQPTIRKYFNSHR